MSTSSAVVHVPPHGTKLLEHIHHVVDRESQRFGALHGLAARILEAMQPLACLGIRDGEAHERSTRPDGQYAEPLQLVVGMLHGLGMNAQVNRELPHGRKPLTRLQRPTDHLYPQAVGDLARQRLVSSAVEVGSKRSADFGARARHG